MMTQTHILLAAGAFTKSGDGLRNSLVVVGSLVPDLALYVLFAIARFQGVSPEVIFNQLYWSEAWQSAMAPGNSFLLFGLLFAIGIILTRIKYGNSRIGLLLALFAASALLHIGMDFPLHVNDAHSHFWPVSDWKFVSSVSYWNDQYHAAWVRPVEYMLAIVALIILFRRFQGLAARSTFVIILLIYLTGPFIFRMNH